MKSICATIFWVLIFLSTRVSPFELTLHNAEKQTLQTSDQLKAEILDVDVIGEQQSAGFASMLPKISVQGNYTYLGTLPSLSFMAGTPSYTFGSHHNYSIGPALNYILWDTFSSLKSFQALSKLKESKQQDLANTRIQLLFSVRASYIRVQLALEELRLVNNSLALARAQKKDIQNRFKAGAATRLDLLTSDREVLRYQIQLEQKQAELSSVFKDLLALVGNPEFTELNLKLDSLTHTLATLSSEPISAPTNQQPQIKSLQLLAESSEKSASAQTAKLFPTIQLSASSTFAYPNGPVMTQINQNMIGLVLSLPLYVGDPTWHLAASKRREAKAIKYRADQLKTNILRDFSKASEMLHSLYEQKKLCAQDVLESEEAAKLYYQSYQAGKMNLINVQTANNQELQSKVNSARIDAQILNQLISLMALSGTQKEEFSHESP